MNILLFFRWEKVVLERQGRMKVNKPWHISVIPQNDDFVTPMLKNEGNKNGGKVIQLYV